jgi:hypothetical protein
MTGVLIQVRLLLGFGAVPAIVVFFCTWFKYKDSGEYSAIQVHSTPLTHSLTYPFTHAFTHPFTHSCVD